MHIRRSLRRTRSQLSLPAGQTLVNWPWSYKFPSIRMLKCYFPWQASTLTRNLAADHKSAQTTVKTLATASGKKRNAANCTEITSLATKITTYVFEYPSSPQVISKTIVESSKVVSTATQQIALAALDTKFVKAISFFKDERKYETHGISRRPLSWLMTTTSYGDSW